jgi:fatty acid desaturase
MPVKTKPRDPVFTRPRIAWPTVGLFAAALLLWSAGTALALTGAIPAVAAIAGNTLAVFMFFTVMHDASHRALSTIDWLNDAIGRISVVFFSPLNAFPAFRYIHMQHHMHTNDHDGRDPDAYTGNGPKWTHPFRWATLDINYYVYYVGKLRTRPGSEKLEALISSAVTIAVVAVIVATGHGMELLLYYVIPSRLAVFALGYGFDYLPHHSLEHTGREDKFKATRLRVGLEWLLTPLMLYQNYHLVHHLHPVVPFYRYLRVWDEKEHEYLRHDPALVTVTGRELSVEEYRELRRRTMEHHQH